MGMMINNIYLLVEQISEEPRPNLTFDLWEKEDDKQHHWTKKRRIGPLHTSTSKHETMLDLPNQIDNPQENAKYVYFDPENPQNSKNLIVNMNKYLQIPKRKRKLFHISDWIQDKQGPKKKTIAIIQQYLHDLECQNQTKA